MAQPLVSVIIPAYNNAEYLGETIQSVLNQTYSNLEVMVVNDASPDNVHAVVQQFNDARIKYIRHEKNQGLSAARNTGIRASIGEIIALLDGDDLFHPKKLQVHVEFLTKNSDVGVTYNSRFELNHSSKTIRALWRPPGTVTLSDLVLSFPFSPSDMMLRRDWAFRVNLFDESYPYVGEDLDINCRLALACCKFVSVGRALNYRRYHSGRKIRNLPSSVSDEIRPLETLFADPRCPVHVSALRDMAYSNRYLGWAFVAFAQDETVLGQRYCSEAVRLEPSLLDGKPCRLIRSLVTFSILDESTDHEGLLRSIFYELPSELVWLREQYSWAVGRAYLLKGTRAILWGRHLDGQQHFREAVNHRAPVDESFLAHLVQQVLDYETEFGVEATEGVLEALVPYLKNVGGSASVRWLNGCFAINRAFEDYRLGKYANVPYKVVRAFVNDWSYLRNRGVLSMLVRSLIRTVGPVAHKRSALA